MTQMVSLGMRDRQGTRDQKWLEDIYASARDHLDRKEWESALDCFEQILMAEPGYLDTAQLAADTWREIRAARTRNREMQEAGPAQAVSTQGSSTPVVQQSPSLYDVWRASKTAKERQRMTALYSRGLDYYMGGQWMEAAETFSEIISIEPSYRHALDLLEDCREQMELQELHDRGMELVQTGDWEAASAILLQIHTRAPGYKNVPLLLRRTERMTALDQLYAQGSYAYENGNWNLAIESWEQVLAADDKYLDTAKRLLDAISERQVHYLEQDAEAACKTGRWAEAAGYLQAILALRPNHPGAEDRLHEVQAQRLGDPIRWNQAQPVVVG